MNTMVKQVKKWEAAVRRELKSGSSKAQVTAFLDKKKIKYRDGKNWLGASIDNCPTEFSFIQGHIEIRFLFDEPDSLASYTVKSGY
ncbi:MAG TPA: hypothetical protein VGO93_27955 [Candidatus Xenobia bacterium]